MAPAAPVTAMRMGVAFIYRSALHNAPPLIRGNRNIGMPKVRRCAEGEKGVTLVDFWATWCGPCKVQAPIVEQVAERLQGKVKVAKLDVDKAPKIAKRFGIQAIPTLYVFKNGKLERQFVGLTTAESLVSSINSVVDAK